MTYEVMLAAAKIYAEVLTKDLGIVAVIFVIDNKEYEVQLLDGELNIREI